MIQLSPFEAEKYKNCPVVLDFSSGFYIFPVSCIIKHLHRELAFSLFFSSIVFYVDTPPFNTANSVMKFQC